MPTLQERAVHEAAHLVVACALGCSPHRVSIRTSRLGYGEMEYELRGLKRNSCDAKLAKAVFKIAQKRIIVASAGFLAQELFFPGAQQIHSKQDRAEIRRFTKLLAGLTVPRQRRHVAAHVLYLRLRALRLIARHHGKITKVARALLNKRELDGKQIAYLMRRQA